MFGFFEGNKKPEEPKVEETTSEDVVENNSEEKEKEVQKPLSPEEKVAISAGHPLNMDSTVHVETDEKSFEKDQKEAA